MPDIKTALLNAITKTKQEKLMDAQTLNEWDNGTADSKAETGAGNKQISRFPVTTNITRAVFNHVLNNPGTTFAQAVTAMPNHNKESISSLLSQMARQGLIRREGTKARYNYYAIVQEFRPLKCGTQMKKLAAKAQAQAQAQAAAPIERKRVVIVRPKIVGQKVEIETVTEAPTNAGLAALKVDTKPGVNVAATLDERGARYGKFTGHASVTQALKHTALSHAKMYGTRLAPDQVEALEMICHKIGRIVNGDPNYADSWIDIAGYAKLIADRLDGIER